MMQTIDGEEVKHRTAKAVWCDVGQVMSAGPPQQEVNRMYFFGTPVKKGSIITLEA